MIKTIEQNLSKFSDKKVAQLMRWYQPLNVERMGDVYKKYVAPTETGQSLMIGYNIKEYLEKRIGEPE